MADKAAFVKEARAQGIPDEKIAAYLAKRTGSEDFAAGAAKSGATPTAVVDFLVNKPDAVDAQDTPAAPLKANDTLGFVNGGAKVFNNVLGAGSQAAQAVGIPANIVHGVGSMIRKGPVGAFTGSSLPNKDQIAALNASAANVGQRPGKLGQAAGEVAATIPAAVASAGLAPEALGVSATSRAAPILNALAGRGFAGAAIQGAEQGLQTTNKTDAAGIAQDAALTGALGVAGQGINKGIAAFAAPRFNASMNTLLQAGQKKFSLAELTGNPQIKKVEDAVRSTPLLGGLVEGSQGAAEKDFNRAYLQRAADTAGLPVKVTTPSHETYGEMKKAFNSAYDQTLSGVHITTDRQLYNQGNGAGQTIKDVVSQANPALADKVDHLFTPRVDPATGAPVLGSLSGTDVKSVDQYLRQEAKAIRNPGGGKALNVADSAKAKAIDDARAIFRGALERQFPDRGAALTKLDTGYAMFKRAQEASTGATGKVDPGLFTPQALKNATYKAPGAASRASLGSSGDIPGQDLVDAAVKVMGSRVADSGTGFRVAVNKLISPDAAGLAGGAGAATLGHGLAASHPLSAALAAGLYGSYLPGVRDVITNTVVGNSRNAFTKAARKLLDEQALNNLARNATTGTVSAPFQEVQQ